MAFLNIILLPLKWYERTKWVAPESSAGWLKLIECWLFTGFCSRARSTYRMGHPDKVTAPSVASSTFLLPGNAPF